MLKASGLIGVLALTLTFSGAAAAGKGGKTNLDGGSDELAYIKAREHVLSGNYQEALPFLEKALKLDPENAKINHELADANLRLNSLDKAELYSRKAVEKDPNNIDYRATLAGILAGSKKYPEAKEQYLKIQELDPSNQRVPLLLGILDAESGNLEEGIKTLTRAIEANPDSYMAYFYRAKVYLEMEDVEKAKADLDKSLTLRPSFMEAGTALGMIHERLGEVDQAINVYQRIQGNGRFKKRLGQLYLQKNEFAKALEEFNEFEKLEPDDYSVKVKIGLIYFEIKKYDQAVEKFKAILKEQSDAGNVRFYLGVVYEEMKKPDLAIAEFKRVSFDSGFYKEAMLHVGFLLKENNRIDEGVTFTRGVLNAHKDVVEFYDMHASFYEYKKDYRKALAIVNDGLKKYVKDEKLLYFEGALLDKLGERPKAISNMKRILEINPDNAHALNFLAYTYAEMNQNLEEAETLIKRALTLRPNDGYIEDSMAWILYKQGKMDEAYAKLQHAATLQPDEPVIYEHMGDVYHAKKDYAKALESYKKSTELALKKKDKESVKKVENKIAAVQKDQRNPSSSKK